MFTVTIIGGGPAGAAAAIALLAGTPRDRVAVHIIEARAFPRSKVCGEFISPAAMPTLESLIGRQALIAAGARPVHLLVLEQGRQSITWPLPAPALALSRRGLDDLLLRRAIELGCDGRQPERVESVEYRADHVVARLANGAEIRSDVVIHADGSGRHDPAGPVPMRNGVVGLKCFLRGGPRILGVTMRSSSEAYFGTIAVEDGLATLAMVTRTDLLRKHHSNPDRLIAALWPDFDPAWRDGEWHACGVADSRFIAPGHPRSLRIGNAAGAVEPIGGEGIGLALWSGAMAGRLLAALAAAHTSVGVEELHQVQRTIARAYRSRLRVRRPMCKLAAAVLMRHKLMRCAWPLLHVPSLTIGPWYRLTGKPRDEPGAKRRRDALEL